MKKSKIIFLCNILIAFLLCFNVVTIYLYLSKDQFNNVEISNKGTIIKVETGKTYTELVIKSNKRILAYINKETSLKVGDVISFKYKVKNVDESSVAESFNYRKYLKSINISLVVEIDEYKKVSSDLLYKMKRKFLEYINSKKSSRYLKTFLLSDKSDIEHGVKDSFSINGINHMLAVSGFHVLFFVNMLTSLFRKLKLKDRSLYFFIVLFATFYLFVSDFSVPLLRAFLIFFLNSFNKKFFIKLNKYQIFLICVNLCLFNRPYLIYNVGFYYTFVISFFLSKYENRNLRFINTLSFSLFAFLTSLPITIYINHSFNFLTILYNLFFVYIVCYLMYPLSFLALLFPFFDITLCFISKIFEVVSLKLSKINTFCIVIPKFSFLVVILLYIALFLYVNKYKLRFLCLYLLIIIFIKGSVFFDETYRIYFVNVFHGDMSVIIFPKHKTVGVIDTGGIKNNIYFSNNIKLFLHGLGISRINFLITTHGDYDHMGEAINLVENFKVNKVIFNCGEFNDLEQELIKVLDKKKIPYYSCIKELNIDKNKLYFLQTKEYDNENDNSNVIYTKLNGYKFMFMGDASITTEQEIMNKYNLQDIDVLKVGHHGSKTSSGKEFINEIKPKYSIISVGKNNRYGHPNKEVLDNLSDSKIYRTDQDGSIMFKIKDNKLKIETCSP